MFVFSELRYAVAPESFISDNYARRNKYRSHSVPAGSNELIPRPHAFSLGDSHLSGLVAKVAKTLAQHTENSVQAHERVIFFQTNC